MIEHIALEQILMECGPILGYDPNCERIVYHHTSKNDMCVAEKAPRGKEYPFGERWVTFHSEPFDYHPATILSMAQTVLHEHTELQECQECSEIARPTLTAYHDNYDVECHSCGKFQ